VFEALSFLVGFSSVVPQVMMPFAADLAPPEKRATALSIVLSGLLLGILFARVVAGIIAQFATWRVVYWMAVGLQGAVLALLYFKLPDFPPKNRNISYFGILWTMAKFAVTEPLLIQTCLISIASMACFINFWVRAVFLSGVVLVAYIPARLL
jgi:predicted MFS family arabinose efflux permease